MSTYRDWAVEADQPTDPNADLLGFEWHSANGATTFRVLGTTSWSDQYVQISIRSVSRIRQSVRLASLVRHHKLSYHLDPA